MRISKKGDKMSQKCQLDNGSGSNGLQVRKKNEKADPKNIM